VRTCFRYPVASLLMALSCLSADVAAYAASGRFSGKTSQNRRISFTVSGARVRHLDYRIVDNCPGGQRLIDHDSGFPPIRISHSKFGGTFVDRVHHATAVLNGTTAKGVVRGTITDRKRSPTTHKICVGNATFKLRQR
jgi:hypothetical protein